MTGSSRRTQGDTPTRTAASTGRPSDPTEAWPVHLRALADAARVSPVPSAVIAGEDNLVFWNEAWASLAEDVELRLLGRPLPAEGAIIAGFDPELASRVRTGGSLDIPDRPLRARISGKPRRFDLHAGPIGDSSPAARDVFCTAIERHDLPSSPQVELQGRSDPTHLLALVDGFRAARDIDDVLRIALPALGAELGAARACYGEFEPAHEVAGIVAAWTDGTLPKRAGKLGIGMLACGHPEALRRGQVGRGRIEEGSSLEALVFPLLRDGRLRGFMMAERQDPRPWTQDEICVGSEIASRTWEAAERALAASILRRNQARQGFLLVLGDRLRELEDSDEIMETVAESLGRHLKLSRVGYGEVSDGDEIVFRTGWSDGSIPPLVGTFPLDSLGAAHVGDLSRGLTTAFDPLDEAALPTAMVGLRALAAVPLIRDGQLRGALVLGSRQDHRWTSEDIALSGEAAARLWEALERARAEAALYDLNATLEHRVIERTEALAASEARFRTLFENAPAPIYLIRVGPGREAVFEALNAAAASFHGKDAEAMRGTSIFGVAQHGEPVLDICLRCAGSGQPADYEITVEDEAGTRTAECVLAPLQAESDATQILIGIARDITAQREAEEQLRQAQKMEAIGQLTGGIAHDFNNLLTGIIGSIALMEKRLAQGRTEVLPRYAGLAMASANRAAALTHRLLAFSRRQPLEARSVNVNTLVASMADLLRRTLGEGVVLDAIASPGIWPTLCDPHQLENAVLNLAINARDAMPDGGRLTIETSNLRLEDTGSGASQGVPPGDYVVVSVADTGSGMSPDVMARAFDPFFTTKPIGQGTGLGLSMIYGFARQSDGYVKLESEIGRGTTVRIVLPRFRGSDKQETSQPDQRAVPIGAGETVLVVEDDATVRDLVLEVLSELGYRALEAPDGATGLRLLSRERRIDLLVTDVGLPGMNGRQLAEQARAQRPDLKVLFITGYAENTAFGAGHLEAGMQMMTKPFAIEDLAARIRTIIEQG